MLTKNDVFALFETFGIPSNATVTVHSSLREVGPIEDGADGLIDAIQKDCDAGLMAQNWVFHDKYEECYYLIFSFGDKALQDATGRNRIQLRVWTNSVNTAAYLQQMLAIYAE